MIFYRRSLKILAESYAIKGLCLENLSSKSASKFKQAERETEMVSSIKLANTPFEREIIYFCL